MEGVFGEGEVCVLGEGARLGQIERIAARLELMEEMLAGFVHWSLEGCNRRGAILPVRPVGWWRRFPPSLGGRRCHFVWRVHATDGASQHQIDEGQAEYQCFGRGILFFCYPLYAFVSLCARHRSYELFIEFVHCCPYYLRCPCWYLCFIKEIHVNERVRLQEGRTARLFLEVGRC